MMWPSRSFAMMKVNLPDLGEGTKEATIKEWYVKPGDRVEEVSITHLYNFLNKQFDDLVEVYTDKLVAKIPSTCSGIVKSVKFEIDDVCLVGHSLLEIEVEGSEPEAVKEQPKKEAQVPLQEIIAAETLHGPGK